MSISVHLDFPNGEPVAGITFSVCASPGDGSLVDVPCKNKLFPQCIEEGIVVPGAALAALNGGQGPQYFGALAQTDPTHGWTLLTVVSFLGEDTLAPQDNAEIAVAQYDLLGPAGSVSELTICETGNPLALISVSFIGGDTVPTTQGGMIEIVGNSFLRGDCDGNGEFNGLLDAIRAFDWGFQGLNMPPCIEACDGDANGTFNALIDGLFIASHQFLGGPPPPAPFPACGADPQLETSLGCEEGCP